MNKKFIVYESQLEYLYEALDAIMIARYILQPDDDGNFLVSPEAVASMLSLVHSAINETLDNIGGHGAKEAQA